MLTVASGGPLDAAQLERQAKQLQYIPQSGRSGARTLSATQAIRNRRVSN
jgi:hypothetical protein